MDNTQLLDAVNEVRQFADKTQENPLGDTRTVDSIEVNQWVRQGDIYLQRIPSRNPEWKETGERQLAIGTSMGSRHTVDSKVKVYKNPRNGTVERSNGIAKAICLGHQVESKDRFTVMHPEHADISLPGGCYQVSYQTDPATQQRVQD